MIFVIRQRAVLVAVYLIVTAQFVSISYAIPADYAQLPACDGTTTTYCISEFLIAPPESPDAFATPVDGVTLTTHFYDSGSKLWIDGSANGNQDLIALVPPGSIAKITLNIGTTKLGSDFDGISPITSISTTSDATNGNTLSLTMRAASHTVAFCSQSAETECAEVDWTSKTDYQSRINVSIANLPYSGSEGIAWGSLFNGMRRASNAAKSLLNSFDPTTQRFSYVIQAPHLRADNITVNDGSLSIFIPDAVFKVAYAVDPDTLVAAGANGAVGFNDTNASPATVSLTRMEGGVQFHYSNFTYSRRTFVLKPKVLLSKPKSIQARIQGKKATLTLGKVTRATRYQGVCIRAGILKSGFSKRNSQTVSVSKLSRGRWSCRGRGVAEAGGRWSSTVGVNVRAR
jgi:hypothetical protein